MAIERNLIIFNSWHLPFLIVPYSHFQKNETLESWNSWLLSNLSRLLNWKGPGTKLQYSKMFKRFLKITALASIYQLTNFGDLMSCGSKMHLVACTNTHHDVTDFVDLGIAKNTKTWISLERNITFLGNKKVLNLRLRWHILRSYCVEAEVTFKSFFLFIRLSLLTISQRLKKNQYSQISPVF